MKILLVRPRPDPETIGLQHVMLVEPLELEMLAAATPSRDVCVLADMVLDHGDIDDHVRRHRPDVLAVTGYITNVPAMIAACQRAKTVDPRVTTVVGGVHVEVCPGDLDDPAVDLRVVRNAVTAWPALLDHVRDPLRRPPLPPGVLRAGEAADEERLPPRDFATVVPDRTLTARHRHRYFYIFHDRVALLKTAAGCPYPCNFCFCRQITGGRYHPRPLGEVLDELRDIDEREIYIVDDDFLLQPERVAAFVDGVRARGIAKHYLLYGRADFIAAHPALMERFRDAGLRTVIVGFESFDDEELRAMDKGVDAATNREAMSLLRRLGIDCYATIILQPHWGPEHFAALRRTLAELGIHYVNLQPLTPLPGTDHGVSDDDLVIPRSDFARWDLAHVTVRPERMSVAATYGHIIASYRSILYRPRVLMSYATYPPASLWRMISGNAHVYRQYLHKMREARDLG